MLKQTDLSKLISGQAFVRPPVRVHAACRASPSQPEEQSSGTLEFKYNSGDGHMKATLEQVFSLDSKGIIDEGKAPWQFGWQMNERNILWSDDLKTRLVKRVAADELNVSEGEFDGRLATLLALLPGVEGRLANMPPKLVAMLVKNVESVGPKLVELKKIFPKADVAQMAASRASLLLREDLGSIQASADRLRELMPELNIDLLAQQFPMVLDINSFEVAIDDAKRMMGKIDIQEMMARNPSMILSLQKGTDMIPYDEVPTGPKN